MAGNYTNYTTKTFDKKHLHLGGTIYLSDFNTDYRGKNNANGSSIASRIESDFRWEKKLHNYNYKQKGRTNNAKIRK